MSYTPTNRPEAALDIECFPNWSLFGFTAADSGQTWDFQVYDGHPLDIEAVVQLLHHFTLITFNGERYDIPMLCYALTGATAAELREANDAIIMGGLQPWVFFKSRNCYPPPFIDHIDVKEPTPGVALSLKAYECRMNSIEVADSPISFMHPIAPEHIANEIAYCIKDRRETLALRKEIAQRIKLREFLSAKYNVDLRSKSDAQMAEATFRVEWSNAASVEIDALQPSIKEWKVGYNGDIQPIIPHFSHGTKFKAILPEHISFVTPLMQDVHARVRDAEFEITDKDEAIELGYDGSKIKTGVMIPPTIKGFDIKLGVSIYRLGIGGLHSQESARACHTLIGKQTLVTADVASYYPALIINSKMFPPQLGPSFQAIYIGHRDGRIIGKKRIKELESANDPALQQDVANLKLDDDGKKRFLNGVFGKLFSRFAWFYYPQMGISVTVAGQLSLLMLIERLELSGISVVSANTDGIEVLCPAGREWIMQGVFDWWQRTCNLTLETHAYHSLYSHSVNSYVAVQFDGKVKRKGMFGRSGINSPDSAAGKHPDLDIVADAVCEWLSRGVPLCRTIRECVDIRKFIRVRAAKGGARMASDTPDVNYGRAVRWYYATGSDDYVVDSTSGNKVAGSDGARLVMTLPSTLPQDVDYATYERKAEELLRDIGA